jgi:phage terminase small subunit
VNVVELTAKQRKFCEEYAKTYNATQSYLAAYPNAGYETAKSTASKLLRE